MKYVKLFEQFVAEQDAICEATVMMDALDPHSRDLKKLLKKHNVKMEIGVSGGPGASMGAGTEVTLTGKRSDLEKVLADPMGWDDPDLAEYIEESKSINESYYIETWYVDKNGKEVQLLGSDGTSVFSRLPRTTDIKKHLDHINSLKKIKPFLAGGVTYKVVDRNGKVYMTGDEAQWRHQIGEHNVTKGPKSLNEAVLKPGRDEALANAIIAYFYAVDGTPEGDKLFSMRLNPVRSDIGNRELHKIVGWGKDAIKKLSGVTRVPGDFILPNVISVASGNEFYFADNDLVGPDGKNLIMGLNKMSFRNLIDELVKQGVISAPKY